MTTKKPKETTKALAVIDKKPVAVKKKEKKEVISPYTRSMISDKRLTIKEELFCRFYVMNDDTRSNGAMSYSAAYGIDLDSLDKTREMEWNEAKGMEVEKVGTSEYEKQVAVCSVLGSRLLRKVKVNERVTDLLNELANDRVVDGKMMKWLLSDNAKASVESIKEYNKLRKRIIDQSETINKNLIIGVVRHVYEHAQKKIKDNGSKKSS